MRDAALPLLGTHDFRCFESQWPNRHTSVRTLRRLDIRHLEKWITIEMEADGFLYNMARSIVGSLVEIGRGHWPKDRIQRALETLDRDLGGPVMPAKGLFLVKVDYPQ
jgi:tRNA pseudouridine38-40 synthase